MASAAVDTQGETLAAVLEYHALGCCIIPMDPATKLPKGRWKHRQTDRATVAQLKGQFNPRQQQVPGAAMVFGKVSGNIGSRDFDEMAAYEAWAQDHHELGATLPTVKTRRGMHVYFIVDPADVANFRESIWKRGHGAIRCADGELRIGPGCYSVVPPSIHPTSGQRYEWVRPLTANVPTVGIEAAGLYTAHPQDVANRQRLEARRNEIADAFGEAVAGQPKSGGGARTNGSRLPPLQRATLYTLKCSISIQGSRGSDQCIWLAGKMVRAFKLSIDDALTAMRGWNELCEPPWSEAELRHKLVDADKYQGDTRPRGYMLEKNRDGWNDGKDNAHKKASSQNREKENDSEPEADEPSKSSRAPEPNIWEASGRTDRAQGRRLVLRHGSDIRYCGLQAKWYAWNGSYWRADDLHHVEAMAKRVAVSLWGEVAAAVRQEANEKLLQQLTSFVKASCSCRGYQNAMVAARSEIGIGVTPNMFDADSWLLNVANGTIDLRTGELRPHDRADLITKLAPVEFNPHAECPKWEAFLLGILAGNAVLVGFIQRLLGYCLTGDVREQVLPIFWGGGSNGKSTLLNCVIELLGDYAGRAAPDLLLVRHGKAHPTELADLHGRRLVVANETEDGRQLAESLVKDLTGSDHIKARKMREDFWEFAPTHKVLMPTNHRPEVRGSDHAIWRRILIVPFTVRYWDAAKGETGPEGLEVDKALSHKLKAEAAGILRWLVQGCLEWQRDGLNVPAEVRAATDEYRQEEDHLGTFIGACCVVEFHARVGATDLFKAYQEFSGDKELTQTKFGKAMSDRGFHSDRITAGKQRGRMAWFGIGLLSQNDDGSEGCE